MKKESGSEDAMSAVAKLLTKIDFSAVNVADAAAENPTLFVRAAELRIATLRMRNAAKMQWEKAQAEASLAIRKNAKLTGEKITEGFIEDTVTTDSTVAHYAVKYNAAEEVDKFLELVVEAFRQRRDCLRIVGDLTKDQLHLAAAAEAGAEKMAQTRNKLREKFPGRS